MTAETPRSDEQPSEDVALLQMLARMANDAAASESKAGRHASSARHEQLGAKYRNAADEESAR